MKPKKSVTPKKKTTTAAKKRSSRATPKKTPKKTGNKSSAVNTTPKPTPSKRGPKPLPKSPISDSMRQMTIKDFFQPSQQPVLKSGPICVRNLEGEAFSEPEVVVLKHQTIDTNRRVTRGSKERIELPFSPIFGPQKRKSPRNAINKTLDKTNGLDESRQTNDLLYKTAIDMTDIADTTQYVTANEFQLSDESMDQSCHSVKQKVLNERKSNKTVENDCDSEEELIPVFKQPLIVEKAAQHVSKENDGKYVDKEKQRKLNYLYKNITRRQVDKQMLDIPSVEEITQQFPEVTESPKKDILMNAFIKRIDGIDIFGLFIANIVQKRCLREKTNRDNDNNDDNLSLNMKRLYELPLNRLIDLLPVVFNTLDESEQQSLVSHIFDRFIGLASSEEYRQLNAQNIDFLFTSSFEVMLSVILNHFYKLLHKISSEVNQLSDEHNSEVNPIGKQVTDGLFKQLANAIKFMVKMFKKCSLKIGDIDTEEELIQLFVITFSLALDMRLITDIEWIMDLKELITVLQKHICINQLNGSQIIDKLMLFCISNNQPNSEMCLRIVSLYPLITDFELKRKFCVVFLNESFLTKKLNELEMDYSLQSIQLILNQIDWKQLNREHIHAIIKLISQSMDLPNDLLHYKETICQILKTLDFQINICVPKASDFEVNDIHKLLMILRIKVNASTKRF